MAKQGPKAWSELNSIQLGRCAEQLVSVEFTFYDLSVFTAEVDDRGIDLVVRTSAGKHYDVQVKSLSKPNTVFFWKSKFSLSESLLVALVLFWKDPGQQYFLIPSLAWLHPNALLVSRDFVGKKSKPEWGINLSETNLHLLEKYAFEKVVPKL